MPSLRIGSEDQETKAVDDLVALAESVDGLDVTVTGPGAVTLQLANDSWPATVVPVDSAGLADAERLIATARTGANIVVGNKISEDARARFGDAGWSWLDRRVGAHIVHGPRTFDIRFVACDPLHTDGRGTEIGVPLASPRSDGPIRGRAGISLAAALLLEPEQPPSLRAVAREIGMSPQSLSNTARLLTTAGLVNADGSPALPDLFWALAEIWRPAKVAALAAVPDPDALRFEYHLDQFDTPGWALGGDGAALALGAPVFTTDDRPWFWVPTQTEARRAQRALGAVEWDNRVAAVAVPPTPLVVTRRLPAPDGSPWPLAHPVFVALDLAGDPGRGREILDQWSPEGITRVWS